MWKTYKKHNTHTKQYTALRKLGKVFAEITMLMDSKHTLVHTYMNANSTVQHVQLIAFSNL